MPLPDKHYHLKFHGRGEAAALRFYISAFGVRSGKPAPRARLCSTPVSEDEVGRFNRLLSARELSGNFPTLGLKPTTHVVMICLVIS